jgi:hypothetical protein
MDDEVLYGNFKTGSIAGRQGSSQPEDSQEGPWSDRVGSRPNTKKEEVEKARRPGSNAGPRGTMNINSLNEESMPTGLSTHRQTCGVILFIRH